ncbi:hypothetical protein BD410DRAFT_787643 [Rickenella mellea]|uniref:Uncharacterized protein n=1 Tax=Rickenella mellea TaxID=50990 RepID=A0A4Y7Q787_9AGAM|nr:hypothetical protein BD410DRAFT_787643 [Rickenella mellea]
MSPQADYQPLYSEKSTSSGSPLSPESPLSSYEFNLYSPTNADEVVRPVLGYAAIWGKFLKAYRQLAVDDFRPGPVLTRLLDATTESARRNVLMILRRRESTILDMLELSKDVYSGYVRNTALKILRMMFENPIKMEVQKSTVRRQFLAVVKELCSTEISFEMRREGFHFLYYLLASASRSDFTTYTMERKDAEMIMAIQRSSSHVSVKLAAIAHLGAILGTHNGNKHFPLSELDIRELTVSLVDFTRVVYRTSTRRIALLVLWEYEDLMGLNSLETNERHSVWMNALELCRNSHSPDDSLAGFSSLWWYSLMPVWQESLSLALEHREHAGRILCIIAMNTDNHMQTRQHAFELIVFLWNNPYWKNMFDAECHDMICLEIIEFCRNYQSQSKRSNIRRQMEGDNLPTSASSSSSSSKLALWKPNSTTPPPLRHSGKLPTTLVRRVRQFDTAISSPAALDAIMIFTMPGESILKYHDRHAIFVRIAECLREHHIIMAKELALQATYFLSIVHEWIGELKKPQDPLDRLEA